MAEETLILVTGATGHVGSLVVEKLATADNVKVRAVARSFRNADELRVAGVEMAEMDFAQPGSVAAALAGVQKIFLLTPPAPGADEMTRTLCEAAVAAGTVRHIVKQSVGGAKEESALLVSREHFHSEKHIEVASIPYTFIRPTAFAQQFTGIFPWVYRKGEDAFYLPIGDAGVAWLDVRDIATLAVQALTSEGHESKIYNLTGPTAVSCNEIAELISEATGKPMRFVDMPAEEYRVRMRDCGCEQVWIDQMSIIYGDMKDGWLGHVSEDFEKVTGRPGTTFRQFAQDHKESWQ